MISLLGSLVLYLAAAIIGKKFNHMTIGAYLIVLFLALLQTAMYLIDMFNRKLPAP